MQRKLLDKILKDQLGPNETLQPEVYELILRIIPRIIESGTVYKDCGSYRFGSCEVTEPNAIKRIVNNISTPLSSTGGYKAALIDRTAETTKQKQEIITSQAKTLLPSSLKDAEKEKAANDIAEVILMTWDVVPR